MMMTMTPPDSGLADRLRELAASGSRPASAQAELLATALEQDKDLDLWAQVDLTFLPAPQPAEDRRRSPSIFVARNALVFLPVALTWYAISQATAAYRALVETDANLAGKSFLYLWETGMGGRLGSFEKLSTVAVLDVIIIALVIGLTIAGDRLRRSETAEMDSAADELAEQWDGLLVEISLRLAEAAFSTPAKFKDVLGATATGLQDAVRDIREAADLLRSNAEAARTALDAQTALVGDDLTKLVRDSEGIVQSLWTVASEQTLRLQALAAGLQTAVDALGNVESSFAASQQRAVDALGTVESSFAASQRGAIDALAEIKESLAVVGPALADASDSTRQVLETGTRDFGSAAQDLRSATADTSALLSRLSEQTGALIEAVTGAEGLATEVAALRDAAGATIGPLRDEAAMLDSLVEKQRDAAASAEEIADSLQRIARSVEFGTGQLRSDLDAILAGLRHVVPDGQ